MFSWWYRLRPRTRDRVKKGALIGLPILVVVAAVGGYLVLTDDGGDDVATGAEGTVQLAAATSLRRPVQQLVKQFETELEGVDVKIRWGSGKTIAEEISDGDAKGAQVFVGPGRTVETIKKSEVTAGKPRRVGRDLMVVALAPDSPVTGLADFAKPEPVLGLCAEGTTCGTLGRRALAAAGVEAQIDSSEKNAETLLKKIAAGDIHAGIVRRSELKAFAPKLKAVALDGKPGLARSFAAVVIGDAPTPAQQLYQFLGSQTSQQIFERNGFLP